MVSVLHLPKIGEIMKEATVINWIKKEGEDVKNGEPVVEVETEKVDTEIESDTAGTILKIYAPSGSVVSIGEPLCAIGQKGEEAPEFGRPAEGKAEARPEAQSGPAPVTEPVDRALASPSARRLALQSGIDISKVVGSGPGGRVVAQDIERLSSQSSRVSSQGLSPNRRTIADRLSKGYRESVPVTLTLDADMSRAVALKRARSDVSFTDMFVKVVAACLVRDPRFNATFADGQLRSFEAANIGVAVSVENGLQVPVIRNAEKLSLDEIAAASRALADKAHEGRLALADIEGGTFTLSNLGMFGVVSFTPVINPPQVAILGIGAVSDRPVVLNGEIGTRPTATLSLTFDHRVVDGAEAARFLSKIKEEIERVA